MRFDDRLLTVLSQPAEDRRDLAVRWRQLVDLVARAGANSVSPVVAEALESIRRDASHVDEALRAAAARAVAALPLPLPLLEYFASDSLAVSSPVLAAATLDPGQWSVLRAGADPETRAFIDTVHPEASVQAATEAQSAEEDATVAEWAEEVGPSAYTPPSLHDVVARIERRRRTRGGPMNPLAPHPAAEASPLFRWECGPSGEIAWVDGAPRGALIGRSIARPLESDGDRVGPEVVRAFSMRAPFRDAQLTVSAGGPVSGVWKISGVPAFDPADGRFAGYRGVALRETQRPGPSSADPPEHAPTELLADPDSLRELVHEIKTPLNAIIGFAEIIEGQYLGPADRGYRKRATEIVRQARLLLAAIDDLDFAAKVHSAGGSRARVDLAALVQRKSGELRELARAKGAEINLVRGGFEVPARVQLELADRLLDRLVAALVDLAEPGETLHVSLERGSEGARISISRPNALRGRTDAELFEGVPATGDGRQCAFALRLVRGLARIAGGELVSGRDNFALAFPRD